MVFRQSGGPQMSRPSMQMCARSLLVFAGRISRLVSEIFAFAFTLFLLENNTRMTLEAR